jgi:hypothetical protein
MIDNYFYFSNWYDYNVGLLGGNVSGFTSSFAQFGASVFLPFTVYEINEQIYNTTGSTYDPNVVLDVPLDVLNAFSPVWYSLTHTGINLWANCTDFSNTASTYGISVGTPIGAPPASIYHSGITINVTDTGWIKYDTASGTVYRYFGSLGNQDIPDCALCSSIRYAYPFADLATWTVVDCGTACP